MRLLLTLLLLIPCLSWGLGENIKNNKDAIKEKIQEISSNNNIQTDFNTQGDLPNYKKGLKVKISLSEKYNKIKIAETISYISCSLSPKCEMDLSGDYVFIYNDIRKHIIEANWLEVSQLIKINIIKKVIVAENLYKNLNEDDLKEITNLVITLRALDETSYHSLFDETPQIKPVIRKACATVRWYFGVCSIF